MKKHLFWIIYLSSLITVLIWSMFVSDKSDMHTWFLEVLPAIAGAAVLSATYKRFEFTKIVYVLIWFHILILLAGGKYTYAENPLFEWIRVTFDLSRNYYDRFGHFFQGFVPAMITRELLLRTSTLIRGKWLFFITVSICVSISAYYEIFEWWVAASIGESADSFLGSQGDIWDAQWDMFMCLIGSLSSLILLGRIHNKQLKEKKKAGSELK